MSVPAGSAGFTASPPSAPLELEVTAAAPRDCGRAIVRLAPADMAALQARAGDVVVVEGERRAHARLLPARPGFSAPGVAPLDPAQRESARLALGEKVFLRRLDATPEATEVVLVRSPGAPAPERATLRTALAHAPVARGDVLHVAALGGVFARLEVVEVAPGPVAVIGPGSRLTLEGACAEAPWEGVGGLQDQVQRVREMVELPLLRPDLFDRLGVRPPRGVLFTGPPGSGKTLLARAVARRAGIAFHAIDGPEIVSKHYGDSEKMLREVFARAERDAPAIVFIDEIDAIAPRRDAISGEKQLERRVVAQLLTLLDGMAERGRVLVMAATNLPQSLDPALRRPGRFDREIVFGSPDAAARRSILGVHLAGSPLAQDVDLDAIAESSRGFVGADLAALAREAGMAAMARAGRSAGGDARIEAASLFIEAADFAAARRVVGPSSLRGFALETPRTGWADVGGMEEVKQVLTEAVIWPMRRPEIFRRLGAEPRGGVLLAGPPGGGKTLLARALAGESGANFIPVRATQIMSRWLGDAERAIEEIFALARGASPCVLFFDELDALAPRRDGAAEAATARMLAQLLTEIDGIGDAPGPFVLAATNRPEAIDPALLRPGRFDLVLRPPPPDIAARAEILEVHARGRVIDPAVDLDGIAGRTEGWSGAALAALMRDASRHAIRRVAAQGWRTDPSIAPEDLEAAMADRQTSARVASGERGSN